MKTNRVMIPALIAIGLYGAWLAFNCNMCGRNNMGETDRRPLYMCPECLPKILLATDCDLVERMKQLYTFCEKYRIDEPAKYYKNCLDILD